MNLIKFINIEHLICPLEVSTLKDVYLSLLNRFGNKKITKNSEAFVKELLRKEDEISSIVTEQIAIPHLRVKKIKDFLLSVAYTPNGIRHNEEFNKVRLFFLLLSPSKEAENHIYFLSEIAKLIEQLDTKQLSSKMTSNELYSTLINEYKKILDK